MIGLFKCILIILAVAAIISVILIITFNYDCEKKNKNALVFKFDRFKKLYCVNPERYDLGIDCVYVKNNKSAFPLCEIHFDLFNRFRYRLFRRKIERDEYNINRLEFEQRYMELIAQDIKSKSVEAQEYIRLGKEILDNINTIDVPDIKLEL